MPCLDVRQDAEAVTHIDLSLLCGIVHHSPFGLAQRTACFFTDDLAGIGINPLYPLLCRVPKSYPHRRIPCADFLLGELGCGKIHSCHCIADAAIEADVAYSPDGKPQAGMGVAAGDFNRDGLLDIVKTNLPATRIRCTRTWVTGLLRTTRIFPALA